MKRAIGLFLILFGTALCFGEFYSLIHPNFYSFFRNPKDPTAITGQVFGHAAIWVLIFSIFSIGFRLLNLRFPLFKKELRSFFSSLVGYIAIGVFLGVIGLFLWVIGSESSGGYNILDNGESTLLPLFNIAPFLYLFLIPAITMRSFSEEKSRGTIEFLLTRPVSDLQIVLAKYFAGVVIVFISLLPTLLYFYSVYLLGFP
ncbi:MAG: ABC transporter permease subunit, partial [Bacteroidia bacterium]|nr:ABC transporter permease subunit [Bacteroidia bacterium]